MAEIKLPDMRAIMTPKQLEILWAISQSGTRNTMMVGGARSGKTFMIVWMIVTRALKAAGSRHAILRFRANSVRASIILDTLPKVMKTFFPGVPYKDNRQDSFISFGNGSEIWYGGLDDKERAEKILGLEFVTIYFNETSQIPYTSYLIAKTRLAQVVKYKDIGAKRNEVTLSQRVYVDMNPTGKGHWTYSTFILKVDPLSKQPLPDPENYSTHYINPAHNAQNLTPETLADFANMPERQRKRFWLGEFVTEVQGALWSAENLAQFRRDADDEIPDFQRVVVAIDPSGTSGDQDKRSDEVGIVVAARGVDGRAYVLADRSGKFSPAGWGLRAVAAYREFKADRIVAEINYGGAMVESTIRASDPNVAYSTVTASRGKVIRAEPVAALYEQGKVSHIGFYPQLEDQMCVEEGTLIETDRGQIAVEYVTCIDKVLTRDGFAPLKWCGKTGDSTVLVEFKTKNSTLRVTQCHPMFISQTSEFVSAVNVEFSHDLLESPNWVSSDGRSHGVDAGTAKCRRGITGILKSACSIGKSIWRMLVQSAKTSIFTTSTKTRPITNSQTSSRLLVSRITPNIDVSSSMYSTASLSVNASSVAEGLKQFGTKPRSIAQISASCVVIGEKRPVYNLSVADGHLPEYYANGILTHNCQLTGEGYHGGGSPDRMDALVWALTELMLPTNVAGQAIFELERRNAEARSAGSQPTQPPAPVHAAGSVEWMMAQNGG